MADAMFLFFLPIAAGCYAFQLPILAAPAANCGDAVLLSIKRQRPRASGAKLTMILASWRLCVLRAQGLGDAARRVSRERDVSRLRVGFLKKGQTLASGATEGGP